MRTPFFREGGAWFFRPSVIKTVFERVWSPSLYRKEGAVSSFVGRVEWRGDSGFMDSVDLVHNLPCGGAAQCARNEDSSASDALPALPGDPAVRQNPYHLHIGLTPPRLHHQGGAAWQEKHQRMSCAD